jgi:hypothetical protein
MVKLASFGEMEKPMPSKSKAQQHTAGAAEHGANFPAAKAMRASMTPKQLHDFAATKTKGLPAHTKKKR